MTLLRPTLILTILFVLGATAFPRTKSSLNTGWRFIKSDVANAGQQSFDDSRWQRINLPHTWNVEDPWDDEPGYHRGAAWYRRELIINRTHAGKRLFLYFEGANQLADVYVNGHKAGSHIGGYSAFVFDITELSKPGRNTIAVRVDNSFSEDIPPLTADFNFYGGIYRDVWLIATDRTHIAVTDHASPGVTITTPDIEKGKGTVSLEGNVVGPTDNVTILTTITDASKRWVNTATARPGDDGRFIQQIDVRSAKLWSPESPYLYSVKISVQRGGRIVDEITQPLGFRWFAFDGNGFTLNGKRVVLRGTNRHQDYAGLGNAVPDRLHVRDMQIIKDAGFNFVRLAHYPQDPSVLEACDRLGLLVWEETPLVNYITKSEAFARNSATMVREMIRQHRNHPSVLLWGYMNEIFLRVPRGRDDLYPATVELARDLDRIAKAEDPTRPTAIAFHGNDVYNRTGLGDIPDVIGWNLYQGWYSQTVDDFGKFLDDQHARFPKRPLIVSEYGANGDRRLHSSEPRRFDSTIDYQRHFHESYMTQMEARPYLAGSAIWNQFDFGAEYRGETIPHLNQKGMYTFDRKPKDIHFLYKAKLSTKPVVHIAVADNIERVGVAGEEHTIDVYTNADSVELVVNGQPLGRKPVDRSRKVSWKAKLVGGANIITALGRKGGTTYPDFATVQYTQLSVNSPIIAINVGSNADFVDRDSAIWAADKPYSIGSWGYFGSKAKRVFSGTNDQNIRSTAADPLMQTYVEGLESYKIDVPAGVYDVELLFAEPKFDTAGKRIFDVRINGETVIDRLDLTAQIGLRRFFARRFSVHSKGGISIDFVGHAGEPILNAVRVTRRK